MSEHYEGCWRFHTNCALERIKLLEGELAVYREGPDWMRGAAYTGAIRRAMLAEEFIEHRGYRRCDIPACNCGRWHGGHAQERLREISDVLEGAMDMKGVQLLEGVKRLAAERAALLAAVRLARDALRRYVGP